jgi:hypothetical protein
MEREQFKMMEEQHKKAMQPMVLPDIQPPKPLPPPPPPAQQSSGEVAQKAEEEKRKAARRTNTARGTIFAGETGKRLGGQTTILG